ncbi:PDDEXK nuclease domain-containing protein [Pedobacter gandavensis]|uniref:PDDEXK nuclease domain-containing protein n=1 Tax=Pedobacter gandavensis TaxID=2679963 RepID=UPI002479DC02|nr:PDDEXK nuclease domain-containing protein [Pedobacter gandavensis]WGQ09651.1 PDDEXK nuclease domain-containing protein [Pedobacter gandavensis]
MESLEKQHMLFEQITEVVSLARRKAYQQSNAILLQMYWQIGQLIVEDEQEGNAKAAYGKSVLKKLAQQLTLEFGKGFDERNLNNMRAFYNAFSIWNAVSTKLSWTHYRIISLIESNDLRAEYIRFAVEGGWDTRTLQRNIRSQYVGRVLETGKEEIPNAQELIKDSYIFEFLGLPTDTKTSESTIESTLINHLQQFLMELGKGHAFVGRQEHIVTDTADFFIDLVFYNYYLKCFVLIDLKTDQLTHSAIGQMDMYVRMYNDLKKEKDDHPTIGIILCSEKDETIVKYSMLAENEKLFASKYRLYLPKEAELKELIEQDRIRLELDHIIPAKSYKNDKQMKA